MDLKRNVYLVEYGMLLPKDDREFESYSNCYDKKNGYYDLLIEYDCNDLEKIKESALSTLKNKSKSEYVIVSKQGQLKDYFFSKTTNLEKINKDLNDFWAQPTFALQDVVWSAYKDENEKIQEDFVRSN